jgi:GNAT superfamily N-acetyltransferase
VRKLSGADAPECASIIASLPDWFGLEDANRAFVESLSRLPGAVAMRADRVVGFIALAEQTPESFEIHVMAVAPKHHGEGAGTALVAWAEAWCRERGARWIHVKTLGPSTPDPSYEKTRRFYRSLGYEPLFESLTLWGPENAALILVKRL